MLTIINAVGINLSGSRPKSTPFSLNQHSHRRMLTIFDDPALLRQRLRYHQPEPECKRTVELREALIKNGWDPSAPQKLRTGYYMDPRELFYRTIRVQQAGGIDAAGDDGRIFLEMITRLSTGYMGKIMFADKGRMCNLSEDMVQEAVTKCALVVMRFSPWDRRTQVPKLNNAFAYFTTVIRHRYYETLDCPLANEGMVYLEDLKTENQSVGDLI